ncbi:MAG: hypothetical protein Wins2KO_22860 [Winogradskyella sp.]
MLLIVGNTLFSQTQHIKDMETHTIQTFQVVGISTRTINKDGQSIKDIEKLWTTFWASDLKKMLPNRLTDDIYAVYTDYESDQNGYYTLVIGYPVESMGNLPDGVVEITINKSSYQKFTSKGKMPNAVFNTWLEIWNDKELNRAYKSDFTVHGKKYFDGNNAEVETFISIN